MALTSLDSRKARNKAKESGFDRYEVKLQKESFLSVVGDILARNG